MFKKAFKLSFIQLPVVPLLFASAATTQDLPGVDLTIQGLYAILQGLACWMSRFILVFMIGAIIWYGFQFVISRGNPTAFGNAKKSLGYGIIGVVVILGAYTIIATVGNAVTGISTGTAAWMSYTPLNCTFYSVTSP